MGDFLGGGQCPESRLSLGDEEFHVVVGRDDGAWGGGVVVGEELREGCASSPGFHLTIHALCVTPPFKGAYFSQFHISHFHIFRRETYAGSPELDIGSPELDFNSPELDFNSPELDFNSPELDFNSLELDFNSLDSKVGSCILMGFTHVCDQAVS